MQALGFALELGRRSRGLVIVHHAVELPDEEPRVHAHFNVAEYRIYLMEDARAAAGVTSWSDEQLALAAGVRREPAWVPIVLLGLAVAALVALILL